MDSPNKDNTRRNFIKTSTVAAAAASALPRKAKGFQGGSEEIKVGLVGCGGKGTSDIRQVLGVGDKVKLWAMGDALTGTHKENIKHYQMEGLRKKSTVKIESFLELMHSKR